MTFLTEAFNEVWAKLASWMEEAIVMLPNFVVAVIVVVAFWLLARLSRRVTRRLFERFSESAGLTNLVTTIAYLATLAAGLFVALSVLHLDKTVTSLLAGVGVLGLALGFAFQDLAANFMAGTFISVRRPFRVGQLIETNDYRGKVADIDLRTTTLQLLDGRRVLLPNQEVLQNPIVNYSVSGERRVELDVGVSYDDDLDHVEKVARKAITPLAEEGGKDIDFFYTGFGGSSIDLRVRFWIPDTAQRDFLEARSDAIRAIKKAFDAEGISIPFPIRTLDLEAGRDTLVEVFRPDGAEKREAADVSH